MRRFRRGIGRRIFHARRVRHTAGPAVLLADAVQLVACHEVDAAVGHRRAAVDFHIGAALVAKGLLVNDFASLLARPQDAELRIDRRHINLAVRPDRRALGIAAISPGPYLLARPGVEAEHLGGFIAEIETAFVQDRRAELDLESGLVPYHFRRPVGHLRGTVPRLHDELVFRFDVTEDENFDVLVLTGRQHFAHARHPAAEQTVVALRHRVAADLGEVLVRMIGARVA